MSYRDVAVQALAEEIVKSVAYWSTQGSERWDEPSFRRRVAAGWESRLTAFLAERETELQAQLHYALGEGAGLRRPNAAFAPRPRSWWSP